MYFFALFFTNPKILGKLFHSLLQSQVQRDDHLPGQVRQPAEDRGDAEGHPGEALPGSQKVSYREIHEKGLGDVVSAKAVRYTIYTIYLSLCIQAAETTYPDPFS